MSRLTYTVILSLFVALGVSFGDEWSTTKFGKQEQEQWERYGFSSEKAAEWKDAGFTPETASNWNQQSHLSPKDAAEAQDFGIIPLTFDTSNFTIEEIRAWNKAGFKYLNAAWWRQCKFSIEQAKGLKSLSLDPTTTSKWIHENNLSAEEIIAWGRIFAISPWGKLDIRLAATAKNKNVPVDKMREWFFLETGFDVIQWLNEDFGASEAKVWYPKFTSPAEARKWVDAAFTPPTAFEWKSAGFTADKAKEWVVSNYDLTTAKQWAHFKPSQVPRLQASCPGGVNQAFDLMVENPYDTETKCYEFWGQQIQLKSRTKALYVFNNEPVLVDFGSKSAIKSFTGIVKGKGAYKYIDITGAQRIVPHVEVILKASDL